MPTVPWQFNVLDVTNMFQRWVAIVQDVRLSTRRDFAKQFVMLIIKINDLVRSLGLLMFKLIEKVSNP